jgi:putative N6-adenine-specific DNA methylase
MPTQLRLVEYSSMKLFATCGRGLEPILAQELQAIGATNIEQGRGGVNFEGNLTIVYQANLWLRTAVRVLRPVLDVMVYNPDDLYEACRSILWSNFMTPQHTLAVDPNVRDSNITHSQYAARRVKDAICDQFRDRQGVRPSVDTEKPMIGLNLHISKNRMVLSLDSSWDSLHKRGYRPIQTRAPLNESLAAGLLLHLGYNGSQTLVDPLCGSGTFCIEAAGIALDRPPGLTRTWFGFQGWIDFERSTWAAMQYEARRSAKTKLNEPILGSDSHPNAVGMANDNAKSSGLGNILSFKQSDWPTATPPALKNSADQNSSGQSPGLIICNPPYGERLGQEEDWVPLYRSLGERVKSHWPGWKLAVFTASERLASEIQLTVSKKTPFYNGSLPCHLWEFEAKSAE